MSIQNSPSTLAPITEKDRFFYQTSRARVHETTRLFVELTGLKGAVPPMEYTVYRIFKEVQNIQQGCSVDYAQFNALVDKLESEAPGNVWVTLDMALNLKPGMFLTDHISAKMDSLESGGQCLADFQTSKELGLPLTPEEAKAYSPARAARRISRTAAWVCGEAMDVLAISAVTVATLMLLRGSATVLREFFSRES